MNKIEIYVKEENESKVVNMLCGKELFDKKYVEKILRFKTKSEVARNKFLLPPRYTRRD